MHAKIEALRNFIFRRQHAYKILFRSVHAEAVLEDLAAFCRANESTFDPDARISAVQEGRREVWLRIQNHLNLSPDELFKLSTGQTLERLHEISTEDDRGE